MSQDAHFEELCNEMRSTRRKYDEFIEPYRADLWKYCRTMTGSPWDAEDLLQETLLKAYASLPKYWQTFMTKSYLFRIATNIWLNQCRRKKMILDPEVIEESASAEVPDSLEIRDALALLSRTLPPMQCVALLLMEVFEFTASETALMLGRTEGGVKALLHRARSNIRKKQQNVSFAEEEGRASPLNPMLLDRFLEAFNDRNPDAVISLFDEHAINDIVYVGEEVGKGKIRRDSLEGWSKDPLAMHAHTSNLWGEEVIIVTTTVGGKPMLYNLIRLDSDNDTIVKMTTYYFCQDLLIEAGRELKLPVHLNGYSF
jgi:RNA polymerase sigma factor (sigma-70 family)